jgi:gamma-glutamyltranspeptidase/glutathione hydrolase
MRKIVFLSALMLLAGTHQVMASQPEMASGRSDKPVVQAEKFLAVTAHPQATAAAHQILKQGGSAVDAAIAAQMVLTLVEPQSSGIGGGGFMLHYAARKARLQAFDGRETAPTSALPSLFLDENDQPLSGAQASADPRSVGTPGLLAMLGMAHRQHGRLPWASLMQPAIELAENGFVISPRLHLLISKDKLICKRNSTRAYFCDENGQAKPSGSLLQNPLLAGSLRQIASQGPTALQSGPLADALIETLQKAAPEHASLTHNDLQNYQALERPPLCRPYRQYRICGMPPPSAGGVAILQILNLLQQKDISQHKPDSVEAIHLFSEAGRLAFADRERYIADPDTSAIPVDGLLDSAYLAKRAALIKN